jgi:hypothetical protein
MSDSMDKPTAGTPNEIDLVRRVLSAHQNAYARFHNGEGRGVIEADDMAIGYASVELAKALAASAERRVAQQSPVDEPKNDEREYGCYGCGKQGLKKGQRVSIVYCNECDAKHIEGIRRRAAAPAEQSLRAALEAINADAEADILKGNPITGAHHRAIERKLAELRGTK